jgi:ABC-type dipeptide/oligopeptide/nickel transport system ATPase subunit
MIMWAPQIIEELQSPYSKDNKTPDWFCPVGKWNQKKDAMNFVTEGALLDITSWLTGKPQLERSFIDGERGLEWIDTDSDREWQGGVRQYEKEKGEREIPKLHVALKIPVVAKLVGMGQDEKSAAQLEILKRMNFFTPIQDITTQYLTSGQRQVLALIIAVRNSKEGSLILIDEPELSLHVDWQSALVEQLHAPLTGSQLVIATHSPDITMNHLHLCNVLSTSNEDGDL